MFNRKTKASARSFNSLNNTVFLWVNSNTFSSNIEKYANFGRIMETRTIEEREKIKKNNKIINKEKVNNNTKDKRKISVA